MLSNFLTVSEQVLILFILIALGFICGKVKFITEKSAKDMTNIVLFFVTPCVIINVFQIDFDKSIFKNLCITALCTVAIYAISILIVNLCIRDKDKSRRAVLRFGTVFSNCGFMSLPLQQAIIGSEGMLYGSAFIAVFNIMLWSYGVICMSGDKKEISVKKLIINPGVLGVIVAVILFITSFRLPTIIAKPVEYMASLNTPLPMLIIGFYLSRSTNISVLRDKGMWQALLLRLVVIPAVSFGLLYICGVRGAILLACIIATSAPAAAATTMFATRYNTDVELSVDYVSVSTLLSILTMSLLVAAAQSLGS